MPAPNNRVHRSHASDALPSPEHLDRLIEIVRPTTWLPLACAAVLVIAAVVWSVVGHLPVVVIGHGILIRPRKVVVFQAPASGRLVTLRIRRGDAVKKGDVLATIEQPDLSEQLSAERAKLARLLGQDQEKGVLQARHVSVEAQEIDAEKQLIGLQRQKRTEKKTEAEALARLLKERVESRTRLQARGLLPTISDELVQARRDSLENDARIADLDADLRELDSRWKTLESRERVFARENFDDITARRNDIQDARSRIAMLEVQLAKNGAVVSTEAGRVVETTANAGEFVSPGQRLGSIDVDDSATVPLVMAYFPVGDGKKVAPGMRINLTPDSISRDRFGSMLGTVTAISTFPVSKESVASVVGNTELADTLMQQGSPIEVSAEVTRDPSTFSGYRWSSSNGPPLHISAGTTLTARVTVEGRAPITYLLPFLRSTTGVY